MNNILFAACETELTEHVYYSIEVDNDVAIDGACIISQNEFIEGDRLISITVYKQADGTIITDTLTMGAVAKCSTEGSDTVTRSRTISDWGTMTITASFEWYTKGIFSYVKCTEMSSYYNFDSKVVVDTWDESYTEDYVSIGKANATVEYYLYNKEVVFQYQEGTFKITCSDTGTIKDNG